MQRNKKTVTLQMVADYANVSMKTVSNVVNNWPYVTAETRQKVEEAIRIVGYRPNQAARSLVTGKTLIVGVVIPDISNPFFGMAMRGCEDTLYRGGYSLVLCNTNEDVEREKYNLDLLMGRGVDAMIVWGARSCCDELIRITGEAIPVVTVDISGEPSVKNHININVDSVSGAYQATKCLIDQGYRRVAHMEGPTSRITAQRRAAGYYQALQESDLECDPRLVVSAAPSIRGGYRAGLEMLTGDRPEAIFCYNDLMAIGVMIAARELGISVPEALAIVGFDDISQASMSEPPLTTVRIDQYALGRLAGLIVLDQLHGKPADNQSILFPVELKIRGSSGHQVFGLEARKAMLENLISTLAADSPGPL
jgi:DNA-binding LacI/PurR family transcriptional regulator